MNNTFDIIVIGGGHAGVEAALAASRMGKRVAIMTLDRAKLALMSCNPAVGGLGKSHIVKEIDALGGIMGLAADTAGMQYRRLNLSRGPAVWATRIQCDRDKYNDYICGVVADDSNIEVIEAAAGRLVVKSGHIVAVLTEEGESVGCRAVIIASGTFLGGLIHIGQKKIKAGRYNEKASYRLSESLREFGFEIGRLKTGTPPRLDGDSIDYTNCEIQPGDIPAPLFSYKSSQPSKPQIPCYLTYTTAKTKEIIGRNLNRSPMFTGQLNSTGPRYCPSIEDKIHRFPHKETHQIFLEPEGAGTNEIYPNGFSTSLPEEIQLAAMRTIIGLEKCKFTRPGYAVEYDYCPAYQIRPTLETRRVEGLYFAGQINGTSGYEEAAGQGLMAGINAALKIDGREPLILDRSESYIGVMIDDLVTRSTTEPYRMFTSRAEHRLNLREDNARDRLMGYGRKLGLIAQGEFDKFSKLQVATREEMERLEKVRLDVSRLGGLPLQISRKNNFSLADLLRMPKVRYEDLRDLDPYLNGDDPDTRKEIIERAEIRIRYAGYIEKQRREIDKFKKMETEQIPESFDFESAKGLRAEALEKLVRYKPSSLGQAGRIEGITSGDLSALAVWIKRHRQSPPMAKPAPQTT
ncbi:MAG: tRNA uridine-5-carboxymethylaminomethyl(34) synthesis enzyme MnmG [candidate division Zixibacteria bacterium]|nr:tRNA uridine-5-carboxymethylaminomethyl(34) synthesis enzyme MnmG [candidate division Zixibacteria bacterium]